MLQNDRIATSLPAKNKNFINTSEKQKTLEKRN